MQSSRPTDPRGSPASCQRAFHRRWGHLHDQHVRDLAWLIDSPNLLDAGAPQWRGRIACLEPDAAGQAAAWLEALDRSPRELHELHAMLDIGPFTRLGRYAEKLLVFYFSHRGMLAAHGVQVRGEKGTTVGEFDFLLHYGGALMHWELATKFYLLATDCDAAIADYFIGPNLADTLRAKMNKILTKQLALATHPAARDVLPGKVAESNALIKGWLFLPPDYPGDLEAAGVAADFCRGTWLPLSAWLPEPHRRYRPLRRLEWLAPHRAHDDDVLDADALRAVLYESFGRDDAPVMVATLEKDDEQMQGRAAWQEIARAFIVPDDWRRRALERLAPDGPLAPGMPDG